MLLKNIRQRIRLLGNSYYIARRYDVLLEKAVTIKYPKTLSFGRMCTVQSGTYIYGSRFEDRFVRVGDEVVFGANCMVFGDGGLEIGDGVHLGPNVVITTQVGNREASRGNRAALKYRPIKLGKCCWIGAGAVLMPGVVLGDFVKVAPNSVVFGRAADHAVLSGSPARPAPPPATMAST